MGRVIVCALATYGAWLLLLRFAGGFMGELNDVIRIIVIIGFFFASWHFSHK